MGRLAHKSTGLTVVSWYRGCLASTAMCVKVTDFTADVLYAFPKLLTQRDRLCNKNCTLVMLLVSTDCTACKLMYTTWPM